MLKTWINIWGFMNIYGFYLIYLPLSQILSSYIIGYGVHNSDVLGFASVEILTCWGAFELL